jgi:hypothetical protein
LAAAQWPRASCAIIGMAAAAANFVVEIIDQPARDKLQTSPEELDILPP